MFLPPVCEDACLHAFDRGPVNVCLFFSFSLAGAGSLRVGERREQSSSPFRFLIRFLHPVLPSSSSSSLDTCKRPSRRSRGAEEVRHQSSPRAEGRRLDLLRKRRKLSSSIHSSGREEEEETRRKEEDVLGEKERGPGKAVGHTTTSTTGVSLGGGGGERLACLKVVCIRSVAETRRYLQVTRHAALDTLSADTNRQIDRHIDTRVDAER